LEAFIERRRRIVEVQGVEIDIIGAEPSERAVNGIEQMLARRALVPIRRPDRAPRLGADDEAATLAFQPPAENFLTSPQLVRRPAHGIESGGVDKTCPRFRRLVEERTRGSFVRLLAECGGPKTQA